MSTQEQAKATIDTLQAIRWEIQNTLMMEACPWWTDSTLEKIEDNVLAMEPLSVAEAVAMTRQQIEVTE